MPEDNNNALKLAILQAVATHVGATFVSPTALQDHVAGTPICEVDAAQIIAMMKAICAVLVPLCQAIEGS